MVKGRFAPSPSGRMHLGNLFSAFIGVFGLKISAYLQPLAHKVILNLQGRGDESSDNADSEIL